MNTINDQLYITEIKSKLLLLLSSLAYDNDHFTKEDAAKDLAEVLDYMSQREANQSFQQMLDISNDTHNGQSGVSKHNSGRGLDEN